ncbi:hypothetical protein TUM17378_11090 [Shewanella algae]|nr:hypothetical protein TUM17378_11090 [Shewanella algae]BCV48434.1 hypothetical protein TUM17382_11270 [Shewanella algae]
MWSILSRLCPMNITGIDPKASLAPLKKNPAEAGFFLFAWGRCEQALVALWLAQQLAFKASD